MSIKNRPYFVRADKWEDFLNHKTDDETLERCKRIDRMINMDAPVIKNRSEDMEHREIKGENTAEQRLIDANMMAVEESEAYMSAQTSGKINPITQGVNSVVHRKIQQLIADTPTVDPETLPIVRQLRKELATIKEILGDDYDLDRLRELVEADSDGRCVVLPCKVGDIIWILGSVRGVYSVKVRTFFIGRPSLRGEADNSMQMIRTTECDIPIKDFGKTAFLTREAAEAALKGEQNG